MSGRRESLYFTMKACRLIPEATITTRRKRRTASTRSGETRKRDGVINRSVEREERKAAIVRIIAWIVAGLIAFMVGAAVLKWALEELAK
jgi:hypothetical protein